MWLGGGGVCWLVGMILGWVIVVRGVYGEGDIVRVGVVGGCGCGDSGRD